MVSAGDEMTDSVGSCSDTSAHRSDIATARVKMDTVCVIDLHRNELLGQRKKAFDEVRLACSLVNADCHQVQVNQSSNLLRFQVRF